MRWPCKQTDQRAGQVFVSLLTVLTLTGLSPLIMALGSFEIKLLKLNFPRQSRCECDATKSNVKVTVCLSHHLLPPAIHPACTLGKAVRNGWSSDNAVTKIPFNYTWSGKFTLSVRALCQCLTEENNSETVVSQVVLAHFLNPSATWIRVSSQRRESGVTDTDVSLSQPLINEADTSRPKYTAPSNEDTDLSGIAFRGDKNSIDLIEYSRAAVFDSRLDSHKAQLHLSSKRIQRGSDDDQHLNSGRIQRGSQRLNSGRIQRSSQRLNSGRIQRGSDDEQRLNSGRIQRGSDDEQRLDSGRIQRGSDDEPSKTSMSEVVENIRLPVSHDEHNLSDSAALTLSSDENENDVKDFMYNRHPNDTLLAHIRGSMTIVIRVVCQQHYYGNGCNHHCKPRDDYFGHFQCSDQGRKICLSGWKGKRCTEALCDSKCLPSRGHCRQPFTCTCLPGWYGKHCKKCQTSHGCLRGFCRKPAQCLCQKGWSGPNCDKEIDYDQMLCQNGGTRTHGKECLCVPGYTGVYCEFILCKENICYHNGSCLLNRDGPYCVCQPPFVGEHCQHTIGDTVYSNSSRTHYTKVPCAGSDCKHGPEQNDINLCENVTCLNNGSCEFDKYTQRPFCACLSSFTGNSCETSMDPCVSNPCRNGAKCIIEVKNNNDDIDDNVVGSGSSSTDTQIAIKCECRDGFVGKLCDFRRKPLQNINDNMTNMTNTKCGSKCKVDVCRGGATCQNGGQCVPSSRKGSFYCKCRGRWTGEFCETDEKDPCASQVCLNGGRCLVESDVPSCLCLLGYEGHYCEIPIRRCSPRTCNHAGLCLQHKRQFFCVCRRNYFGNYCERTWRSEKLKLPLTVNVSYSKCDSCKVVGGLIILSTWLIVSICI